MCKVSVIMPSLNVRGFIRESVCSVAGQTLEDIEILCIDAGSEDGTWEILQELSGRDRRIRLYRSDIRSYGYQMNLGLRLAKGEYVAAVETDDYIDAGMYGALYRAAEEHGCDYVKSDYISYWTQEDGERHFFRKRIFLTDDMYGRVLEPGRHPQIASGDWYLWNGIYRRSFLEGQEVRFHETPGAAFQDIGFLHQTATSAGRVLYLRDAFYRYCTDRCESSSNSGKALEYSYQEFRRLVEEEAGKKGDGGAWQALYIRMAKSFLCSYPDIHSGGTEEELERRALYYAWFKGQLEGAIKNRWLDRGNVHSGIWDKLGVLLVSEEHYRNDSRRREEDMERRLGRERQYPVAIFGCGYQGYLAYRWLKERQYPILAFLDNDRGMWGRMVGGVPVRDPEEVAALGGTVYLVASVLYGQEMAAQLAGYGIGEERIVVFP